MQTDLDFTPTPTPAAPTPPATPPPTSTPTSAPPAPTWYAPEVADFVKSKGWADPNAVIDSYRNLEQLQRTPASRTVVLPEDLAAEGALDPVFDRLGRPATPDGYEFDGYTPAEGVPDLVGGDDGFRSVAHKVGITKTQASELFKWYQGRTEGLTAQTLEQLAERATAGMEAIKTKWGAAYPENTTIAKQGVSALGVAQTELEALENALGTERLMDLMYSVGKSLGEHARPFDPNVVSSGNGALTPADAQSKISELMADEVFFAKYAAGEPGAVERITKLTQAVAGTALVRPTHVAR